MVKWIKENKKMIIVSIVGVMLKVVWLVMLLRILRMMNKSLLSTKNICSKYRKRKGVKEAKHESVSDFLKVQYKNIDNKDKVGIIQ